MVGFRSISAVAIPAIIQNAAAPLTSALQTALLGRYASTSALAAFAAVSISANFASRLFNFLVDGVSATVGRSVGQGNWWELAFRVKLALCCALGAGVVAASLLASVKGLVLQSVLELSDGVLQEASGYWWLRCALVPVLLFNMSCSGILQGFHRVRASAALNSCQSLLELAGSAAVLVYDVPVLGTQGLLAMGLVGFATQLALSVAAFTCILLLPPREASGGSFRMLDAWFPSIGSCASCACWWRGAKQQPGSTLDSADVEEPLLRMRTADSVASLDARARQGAGKLAKLLGGSPVHELLGGSPPIQELLQAEAAGEADPGLGEPVGASGSGEGSPAAVAAARSAGRAARTDCSCPLAAPGGQLHSAGPQQRQAPSSSGEEDSLRYTLLEFPDGSGSEVEEEDEGPAVAAAEDAQRKDTTFAFLRDGLNMLVRSMVLQITFFASLVAASRLGTASLAAHSIIGQLWILISYVVDGFAAAGIVLGSRLAAHAHNPHTAPAAKKQFRQLIQRVLGAGLVFGIGASILFATCRCQLVQLFSPDPQIDAALDAGPWLVMTLIQPVNGMVFVYDGLMYASQSFRYIRNMMLLGLLLVFTPLLLLEELWTHALWGVWLANAAVNLWRLCGAAWLIHGRFMREFDSGHTS